MPCYYCLFWEVYLKSNRNRNFDFRSEDISLPKYEDISMCREIHCSGDLYRTYWVAYEYNVVDFNESRKGIIGAILLKLLHEKRISIVQKRVGKKLINVVDLSLKEEAIKLYELKKFSASYSLIDERMQMKYIYRKNI